MSRFAAGTWVDPQTATGIFLPRDRGFKAWSIPPNEASATGSPVLGTLTLALVSWPGGLMSNIFGLTISPIVGATAGQNFFGVYEGKTAGNLLGQSGDLSVALATPGLVTGSLAVPVLLPPGVYYLGVLQNASSAGASQYRQPTSSNQNLAGVAPQNQIVGVSANTAITALPATLGTVANSGIIYFMAAN